MPHNQMDGKMDAIFVFSDENPKPQFIFIYYEPLIFFWGGGGELNKRVPKSINTYFWQKPPQPSFHSQFSVQHGICLNVKMEILTTLYSY